MPAVAPFAFQLFDVAPRDVAPLTLDVEGRPPELAELDADAPAAAGRDDAATEAPGPPPAAGPSEPAPVVVQAELERAVAEAARAAASDAEQRVRAELTAELEAATERCLARALERCADELGALRAAIVAAAPVEAEAELALAIARAIVPHALERAPLADIEAMLLELLRGLDAEPRLELRLAAELVEPGQLLLAELRRRSGFAGELLVTADDDLAPGDARLFWRDGRAERRLERIVAEVEAWLASRDEALDEAAMAAGDPPPEQPEQAGGVS